MDRNIDIWKQRFECAVAFVRLVRANNDLDFGIQPILAERFVASLVRSLRHWTHNGPRQDVRLAVDMNYMQYLNLDRTTVAFEPAPQIVAVAEDVVAVVNVLVLAGSGFVSVAIEVLELAVAAFGAVDDNESPIIDKMA